MCIVKLGYCDIWLLAHYYYTTLLRLWRLFFAKPNNSLRGPSPSNLATVPWRCLSPHPSHPPNLYGQSDFVSIWLLYRTKSAVLWLTKSFSKIPTMLQLHAAVSRHGWASAICGAQSQHKVFILRQSNTSLLEVITPPNNVISKSKCEFVLSLAIFCRWSD